MKPLFFCSLLVIFGAAIQLHIAAGRPLQFGYSADGLSSANPIRLVGSGDEACEQLYGFLPCSKTMMGHLFLILVYEFLLFHAESYVASGGEMIFQILGPGVFGASVFQMIGSLPEALILLASGLSSSNEFAEECVRTGVGLFAGSSILHLTVLWGTCVVLGSQSFSDHLHSDLSEQRSYGPFERLLFSSWPGHGIATDLETSYTARIMLLSVIPLALIPIPWILNMSGAGERVFTITAMALSAVLLLSYFFYQFFQPWIQRRRLLYIKHERLVLDILKHLQNQTMGKLLTENGTPSASALRRLFDERDHDGDRVLSIAELKEFLNEIKFRKLQLHEDKDSVIAEIMQEFDSDDDQRITMDEFVAVMMKWLDEIKQGMKKRYHSVKSLKDLYQVLKPWMVKKKEEREVMRRLMPDILHHIQSSFYGSLLSEDGTPDVSAIKRLFKSTDLDKDDCISTFELKKLLTNVKFGILKHDVDVAASKIMKELDLNEDQLLSEEEFVIGLSEWLDATYNPHHETEHAHDHNTWEEIEKLADDKLTDRSPLAWTKAVAFLVLGIVMLGVVGEPLSQSVGNFSKAINVPPFYVAFILVPLATNARIAVSAVNEARRKKLSAISLTLSEIYGNVFMNNVLGLFVLLSLIHFRGLPWTFSADVLVVVLVSAITGCISSFSTVFPIWTSLLAYLLYPSSLLLVHALRGSD